MGARIVVLPCVLALAACEVSRHDEGDGEACGEANWRAETPGETTCPRAADCSCGGDSICCVTVDAAFEIQSARCTAEASCRDLAFSCDGPEDCGADEVCCATLTAGGGSRCTSPQDCFGIEEAVMCRDDDTCDGIEHCVPAARGSYFDGRAASCQL